MTGPPRRRPFGWTLEADGRTPRALCGVDAEDEVFLRAAREVARLRADDAGSVLVARTVVGDLVVSTVFLGYDASGGRRPEPELWESALFDRASNEFIEPADRYSTWEAARAGHAAIVAALEQRGETPLDHARRISAEDLGWEMDGEEPDDA